MDFNEASSFSSSVTGSVSSAFGDRFGPWTHLRFIIGALLPLPFLAVVAATSRELKRTLFNRRLLASLALLLASRAGLEATCWGLGITVDATRTLQVGVGLIVSAMAAIAIDLRLWPMCMGLAVALAGSVALPAWGAVPTALAFFGVIVNFALVWRAHENARTPLPAAR